MRAAPATTGIDARARGRLRLAGATALTLGGRFVALQDR
jgi:hypothetical protein